MLDEWVSLFNDHNGVKINIAKGNNIFFFFLIKKGAKKAKTTQQLYRARDPYSISKQQMKKIYRTLI